MNENETSEDLAASLSLSLFASQVVMALEDFLTTGRRPETLDVLCEVAQKSFCVSTSGRREVFDPSATGLLPSPEQFKLLPEAITHVTPSGGDEQTFLEELEKDLLTIHGAKSSRARAVKEAARRLQRFFDVLGDLAINESRREPPTLSDKEESKAATWTMPSLIG